MICAVLDRPQADYNLKNVFSKIFDSIVYNKISGHIHSYIINEQHGFVPKRSTITNLSLILEDIVESFVNNNETHVIYLDICKAFDSVNIDLLLSKLECFGIVGTLLCWFRSYLTGRSQRVKIKDFISNIINVISGVGQGSHLGPLLFLVFFNDVNLFIEFCKFLIFADDFKLYKQIFSILDTELLKADLQNVILWLDANGFSANVKKCFYIIFSRSVAESVDYAINGLSLTRKDSARDLGVMFDERLTFKAHIDFVVTKAFRSLFFVLRQSKAFKKPLTLLYLFKSIVIPVVLYAFPIWKPFFNSDIVQLERVQHVFLRAFSYRSGDPMSFYDHDFVPLMNSLDLLSLYDLGQCHEMAFLYKIFNNLFDCPDLLARFSFRVPSRVTRNNSEFFHVPISHRNFFDRSIVTRLSKQGNSLCGSTDLLSMPLGIFKSHVNDFIRRINF